MNRPALVLALLGTGAFSVGVWVQPRLVRTGERHDSSSIMQVVFGEGRRMFANHFAIKADVYLHSGYYPSIFDQAAMEEAKEKAAKATASGKHEGCAGCSGTGAHNHDDHDHEAHGGEHEGHDHPIGEDCDHDFMGKPRDWIEAFGRNFQVTEHMHLGRDNEREILPWLRIAAELDPQRIETFVVGAYWLSERVNKPAEAERFLREGLKENPQSYELLTELGKVCRKLNEPDRARNIWRLALRRWDETEKSKEEPDKIGRHGILLRLADLEESQGHFNEAVRWLQEAKAYSPNPAALDERIRGLWLKATPWPADKPAPLL